MSLTRYLNAPPHVQRAFDRQQERRINADLDAERWAADELADDPVARMVKLGRDLDDARTDEITFSTVDAPWDEAWEARAERARNRKPDEVSYDIDSDPVLAYDLRDAWPLLTGDDLGWNGVTRCPNPEHEDRSPSCSVREERFRCFACGTSGRIIDLGALLYDEEPRGAGYHRIRERLEADLGMVA